MANSTKKKINRPKVLSQWVFFATEKDPKFSRLLGGDVPYINRVRKANRPVISLFVKNRGKYRILLEIDLVEGFDGQHQVKLSEKASLLAFEIMQNVPSCRLDDGCSVSPFFSYGYARYSSLEDAVQVANALADLPIDSYVKK